MEKIIVQVEIDEKREKVWTCWTEPKHVMAWNHASEDWHCPYAENHLKVGEGFKYTMASVNGKMAFDFEGIYTAVEPYDLIAYELGDGRQVTVAFADIGNKTFVIESFDPETENSLELQKQGWQAILDNFKKYVEAL